MRRIAFLLLVLPAGCGEPGPVAIPDAAALTRCEPGTHHQTVDIPGVGNVKYTIEVPSGYDGKSPVPLVLALHYGYDGSQPEPYTGEGIIDAFRSGLAPLGAIVVAPDALGGSWTDAKNEQAAVWLTKSAQKTYAVDGKKVILTGYSLGGEGTWFIGSRHQDLFTAAVPVAAPMAGRDTWTIPVYVIHSTNDEIVPYGAAKRHADALKQKGARIEFKTVSGLTHFQTGAYAPFVGEAAKWLLSAWK